MTDAVRPGTTRTAAAPNGYALRKARLLGSGPAGIAVPYVIQFAMDPGGGLDIGTLV